MECLIRPRRVIAYSLIGCHSLKVAHHASRLVWAAKEIVQRWGHHMKRDLGTMSVSKAMDAIRRRASTPAGLAGATHHVLAVIRGAR